jgi:hypothetical protein
LSSFNNLLEFDILKDDTISSLKNLTNSDLSYIIGLNKLINLQKNSELKNSNIDNKTEIFAAVFQWDGNEKNVYLTGSFCNWLQFFEMRKFIPNENISIENNNKLYLILFLPKGTYQYKFKINSEWKCNSNFPTCSDKDGNINNVMTIPPNKIEEGTTDCTTSHITVPKFEENYFKIDTLNEFSYKYNFNYDLLSNQNKLAVNNFLHSKEKDILNGNYSFKKIFPTPHEFINHLTIKKITKEKLKKDNKDKSLKFGCTFRYFNKMTTFVYYKPNIDEK